MVCNDEKRLTKAVKEHVMWEKVNESYKGNNRKSTNKCFSVSPVVFVSSASTLIMSQMRMNHPWINDQSQTEVKVCLERFLDPIP
jgi:hypothetical protein